MTDREARERIEGRPFKGKRIKLKAIVDSKAAYNKKIRLGAWNRKTIHRGRQ